MKRWLIVSVCLLGGSLVTAAENNTSYLAAIDSISVKQLHEYVEFLADDKLEGREAGQAGGQTAGNYLRAHFAQLALQAAGVEGTYFQPFGNKYRNILAFIPGSDPPLRHQIILVGAHYDHIGYGTKRNSRGPVGQIHNGADDNASGTAAVLELAEAFTALATPPKRSILFAAWDAEEKGLLGSKHWTTHPTVPLDTVSFAVNLDMIGRLREDQLQLFGVRSGYGLRRLICLRNQSSNLTISFSWKMKPHADHYIFFSHDIPTLMFHTGLHDQYHRPTDDAKLINYVGLRRVTRLVFATIYELANQDQTTKFRDASRLESPKSRQLLLQKVDPLKDRLGAVWKNSKNSEQGVQLVQLESGSPAEKSGLHIGDHLLRFAGQPISTTKALSWAIAKAKNPAPLLVRRKGKEAPIRITAHLAGTPLRLGIRWRRDDAAPHTIILTHVIPGSPAARAGLTRNDRIYQVAGHDFQNDAELIQLVMESPDPVKLLVERDGKLLVIVLNFKTKPLSVRRAA